MATLPLARLTDVTSKRVKTGRVPWRITDTNRADYVNIVDADDHPMFICSPEVAGRIVGAVNMVECAHVIDRGDGRIDERS